MTRTLEVFADITCPFTHVGLRVVTSALEEAGAPAEVVVRSWPLEWVNGQPLDADGVAAKITALKAQLDLDLFTGFRDDQWPSTSIPGLNLAHSAYATDPQLGLAVSLQLRNLLFEEGRDIADLGVLAEFAESHDLEPPQAEPSAGVVADFDEGVRRGVRGSPDFWIGDDDFFCPSLEVGHDEHDALTARFDIGGLSAMLARLTA